MSKEPAVYTAEHIKEELLHDPAVGELDLHVTVEGGRVVISGNVSTRERHDAISDALGRLMPGHDIRNETTVTSYPEAPDLTPPREVMP
jgi:hypothetical protein